MVMDILCLILNQTSDILQFFPVVLRIFDNEVIPVLEVMYKSKPAPDYCIGLRLMKSTILIINNLGIGVNLFSHILCETDFHATGKNKGQEISLSWKNLIAYECVAIALNNPALIKMFSQSAL